MSTHYYKKKAFLERNREYAQRIKTVIGCESVRSFADRSGIPYKVLLATLNGDAPLTADALVRASMTAKANIAWLATGEGPMRNSDTILDKPSRDNYRLAVALALSLLTERDDRDCEGVAEIVIDLAHDLSQSDRDEVARKQASLARNIHRLRLVK